MPIPLAGRLCMVAIFVVSLIGLAPPQRAAANDITFTQTVFNTDVAYFGFGGMRGIGTGTITVSGLSGTVTKALLYWHGPTNSLSPTANANVTFAGNAVVGTNIGFSSDNCWGFLNSQAYAADVTALVSGNGSYSLANFLKSDADINGVSLVVFYNDGNPANNRDVVLFHGNDSNINNIYDANGWNVTLAGINYTSGSASIDLHVSDGQTFLDDALILNGSTLVPAGPIFQGDSVPGNPNSSVTNGLLWDIHSFDVTSFLSPGANTLHLTTGVNQDCLSLVLAAVNLPHGAVVQETTPPTCVVTGVVAGPPKQILVQAQDSGSGIASFHVVTAINATVAVDPFSPGTTSPVNVTLTKTDQTKSASVTLTVTDIAGNVATCDPVITTVIREKGQPQTETFSNLGRAESKLTIFNGKPGLDKVELTVNGTKFKVDGLTDNGTLTVDVATAMRAGTNNTIDVKAQGGKGASATIVIHD